MEKEQRILQGSIAKNLLLFTIPIALSSMVQQLFNATDVAVVGRFAGSDALAAVGSNTAITSLFINIFIGLAVGANVIIANYIGQQKTDEIKHVVSTVMLFGLICGVAVLIIGQLIARPLLELTGTPEDVISQATIYLKIYFVGMPFLILYNFGAAILRSIGDTKRPMYCLLVSGVVNLILNLVLVICFKLGVAGVAIATAASSAISGTLVLRMLVMEKDYIRLDMSKLRIQGKYLLRVIRIGAPAAIQSSVFCISNIVIQSGINSLGSDAMAGSSAGLNYEYFAYFVVNAFAQATITFVSQNYGAGNAERCRRVVRVAIIEGVIFTGILSTLFIIFGRPLVSIFTDKAAVMDFALTRMRHVMLLEALVAFYEVPGGALRGMGHSLVPALLTIIGSVGFRIMWLFVVFPRYRTFAALMSVYPVSWLLTILMVMTAYVLISKKAYKKISIIPEV